MPGRPPAAWPASQPGKPAAFDLKPIPSGTPRADDQRPPASARQIPLLHPVVFAREELAARAADPLFRPAGELPGSE